MPPKKNFTPSEVPHLDRYYEKAFKELLSVKSTSKRYFKQNDPIIQCVDESIRELKQAREKMLARSKE